MRSCEQTTCGAFNAISISFMSSSLHLLTQLELREMFQFRFWIGKKKKKHKQDAGALAGFSSDNPPPPTPPKKERVREGRVPKCSFNCGTSIKESKWGRLGETLAHQTDTIIHTIFILSWLKKRKIKVSADEGNPSLHLHPLHSPSASSTK